LDFRLIAIIRRVYFAGNVAEVKAESKAA